MYGMEKSTKIPSKYKTKTNWPRKIKYIAQPIKACRSGIEVNFKVVMGSTETTLVIPFQRVEKKPDAPPQIGGTTVHLGNIGITPDSEKKAEPRYTFFFFSFLTPLVSE